MYTYVVLKAENGAILNEHLPECDYAEIAQREANERGETICAYAIDATREEQTDVPHFTFRPIRRTAEAWWRWNNIDSPPRVPAREADAACSAWLTGAGDIGPVLLTDEHDRFCVVCGDGCPLDGPTAEMVASVCADCMLHR